VADINEAKSWLAIAARDISVAKHLFEVMRPMPVEVVCFHSQQAMEKALKAVLAYHEAVIRKTHEIDEIIADCAKYTAEITVDMRVAEVMSNFAVAARYKEDNRDITEDTAEFAIKQAEQTLDMVCRYLTDNGEN
jgi:HEPN domain-containing protein